MIFILFSVHASLHIPATTCNNGENTSKRLEIKQLIKTMKETNPYVEGNIFKSVENVNLDTVIATKAKELSTTS